MSDIERGDLGRTPGPFRHSTGPRRAMTRKRRRLYLIVVSLALLGVAVALVLTALRQDIVFFLSPTELTSKPPSPGHIIRVGGLVEKDSMRKLDADGTIAFKVTDLKSTIAVRYRGILPDLFREGQGVVIEGALDEQGQFVASEVLAKHDEKYVPPEVAKALKASGRWQETGDQTGSNQTGTHQMETQAP